MKKIGFGGAGPKTFIISVLYFIFIYFISIKYAQLFTISNNDLKLISYIFIIIGLLIYTVSIFQVGAAYKTGKLATTWFYRVFRNPVYASFILFIVPGLAFYFNSWLIFTASIFSYIILTMSIKKEYDYLSETFGQKYDEYLKNVWCKYL